MSHHNYMWLTFLLNLWFFSSYYFHNQLSDINTYIIQLLPLVRSFFKDTMSFDPFSTLYLVLGVFALIFDFSLSTATSLNQTKEKWDLNEFPSVRYLCCVTLCGNCWLYYTYLVTYSCQQKYYSKKLATVGKKT